jgi:nucleoside-diphosphate-sugar epimerase
MAIWLWSTPSLGQVDEPLHIGSEQSLSILDLAETVAQVSGKVLGFIPKIVVSKFEDSAGVMNQYEVPQG